MPVNDDNCDSNRSTTGEQEQPNISKQIAMLCNYTPGGRCVKCAQNCKHLKIFQNMRQNTAKYFEIF